MHYLQTYSQCITSVTIESRILSLTHSHQRVSKKKIQETHGYGMWSVCSFLFFPPNVRINTTFYKTFCYWKQLLPLHDHLDAYCHPWKFQTLLPAYTLYQMWAPYLKTSAITLFDRTKEWLPTRPLCTLSKDTVIMKNSKKVWQHCSKSSSSPLTNRTWRNWSISNPL